MTEIKLPISQKEDFKEAFKNFKASVKEYTQVCKNYGFNEYTTDLNDILNRYAEAAFQASLEQDVTLKIRQKGYKDFDEFKNVIIQERNLNRNDELSSHHLNHLALLDEVNKFIPNYDINEEYKISFYTFEGCELDTLLKKYIESFYTLQEIQALIPAPFGIPESNRWTNKGLDNFIFYHPAYPVLSKEPTLKNIQADPNKEGFYRISEEEEMNIKAIK